MTPAVVIDHIVALSLGGTNDSANLAPACQGCNAEKAKAEQRFHARCLDLRDMMSDVELGPWMKRAKQIIATGPNEPALEDADPT